MTSIRRILLPLSYLAALLGAAPVYLYLDRPVQVVALLALPAGIFSDRSGRQLLGNLTATLLALAAFVLYLVQVGRGNLVEPVINLLVLLLALRLITDKTPRHVLQLFVLAMFTLAASSLVTLSIAYLFYLVLLVLLVTVGLVLLTFYATDQTLRFAPAELRLLLRWPLLLPAGSLLLMVFFFLVLPRTQHPLWDFLNPPAQARSGFAEQVRPGTFSALAADPAVAFRAEMTELPDMQLYWRGIVLNRIEAGAWVRGEPPDEERVAAGGGPEIAQSIFLEAKQDRYLPTLDRPTALSGLRHRETGDALFIAPRSLDRRAGYQALSRPDGRLRPLRPGSEAFYLQLPEKISPRLRSLAADLRRDNPDRTRIVDRLERFYRDQQLTFASTGLSVTANPEETFLFETHRGYCEYFASSFALLLRLSGVPARLVGGYLGGRYNPLGNYYLVTEEMAHVWVEALLEDGSWRRIDPSRLAVNGAEGLGRRSGQPWLSGLLDSIDHAWNRTVINFDLHQQFELLRQTGASLRRLRGAHWPKTLNLWLLPGAALLGGLFWLWKRPRRTAQERLARAFHALAQRRAVTAPGDGLLALAERLDHPLARQFAARLGAIVYCDRVLSGEERRELRRLLRRLKKELR